MANNQFGRRKFVAISGAAALANKAEAATGTSSLEGRIRDSRNGEYLSISAAADELGAETVELNPKIAEFLQQQETVNYINRIAQEREIPAHLLAAIVAEENIERYPRLEQLKYSLGWDASLGIANIKVSLAAYLMGKTERPSMDLFEKLENQEVVKQELENPIKSLDLAAKYLAELKEVLISWNERNLGRREYALNEAEIGINPHSLGQLANGYQGGERLLDKPLSEKARRVLGIMRDHDFILELYGQGYEEELEKFNLLQVKFSEMKKKYKEGFDLREAGKFVSAYAAMSEAISLAEQAYIRAEAQGPNELMARFLAYGAYANMGAARILRISRKNRTPVLDERRSGTKDLEAARLHYDRALQSYDVLSRNGVNPEAFEVIPIAKRGYQTLPSRNEIGSVVAGLPIEMGIR